MLFNAKCFFKIESKVKKNKLKKITKNRQNVGTLIRKNQRLHMKNPDQTGKQVM
jgi:hypothetical protein